jgi:phosphoribosylanthranilate isomerase
MSRHRTRIKICGIRKTEDAIFAAHAGADAIGLIFYAPSPRAVTLEQALRVRDVLPPFVSTVALFVNAEPAFVSEVCGALRPSLLQFHGDETPDYCRGIQYPYVKAIRVSNEVTSGDLLEYETEFGAGRPGISGAQALLLDTFSTGQYGGSGESFDWRVVPASMSNKIILSGGLTPGNVRNAIASVHPWAVDVSSGVEVLDADGNGGVKKGIKDHARMQAFIDAVRSADEGT